MLQIEAVKAFHDNYIWMLVHPLKQQAICVDPGDATPCLQFLEQRNLQLHSILITHHHMDHVGGIKKLRHAYPDVTVYGPNYTKERNIAKEYDIKLEDGDHFNLSTGEDDDWKLSFHILHTPGHTLDHICYLLNPPTEKQAETQTEEQTKKQQVLPPSHLFCGDTLFAGGCGRLFEGSSEQMHHSLSRLAQLPPSTKVYCAHEYTLANLTFAIAVEPENKALQQRYAMVRQLREEGIISLPSDIDTEKRSNPFLRCHLQSLRHAANGHQQSNQQLQACSLDSAADVFAVIRAWKDSF